MRFILFLGLFLGMAFGMAEDTVLVKVQWDRQENLLKNPGYVLASAEKKTPESWIFMNYSNKPNFLWHTRDGIFHLDTTGGGYGYLVQPKVKVEEGKRYYFEVEARMNSRTLLWVMTPDYHDNLSSQFPPYSQTILMTVVDTAQCSEKTIGELEHFIDPELLFHASTKKWCKLRNEMVVPKCGKIHSYDFKIGSYGGEAGFLEVRNPYFGLAERTLTLSLEGQNLCMLKLLDSDQKVLEQKSLLPKQLKQNVVLSVKSCIPEYWVEITDSSKAVYRRKL